MKIQYYIKNVYGKDLMYIVDEGMASIVRRLTGFTTLTPSNKACLEMLNQEFEQILPPINNL